LKVEDQDVGYVAFFEKIREERLIIFGVAKAVGV
jgi:hypothetical protein